MNFYLFNNEDGFDYYALIYSENEKRASELYKDIVGSINKTPRLINNNQALEEIIFLSNLDNYEIDDLMLEIEESKNTKESLLILVDSKLV